MLSVLNPKSYDRARVLETSGRPMLVIAPRNEEEEEEEKTEGVSTAK